MSYLVLARKWRPQRFEDLVGQDHVSRTLANAIASGRVAHAFLFTGVRGVGKTTSARILAKALNCMGPADDPKHGVEFGPTITPCLQCPACLEIAQGTDMDVREIDGASYNGVDEVRKLQDSLPYRPARDRYKIFIVDEVHMLSSNAWNAFLKTLEEPPAHVKFIFATTEVHKVPVTILSRVQRFDFKLITTQTIATRLREVLSAEKIEADEAAISIVAREAAGSMRDAMSVLDQVIAWGGQKLLGAEVARVLGVASHSVLYELASALQGGDAARSLSIVADLANPPSAPLGPNGKPISPESMSAIFPGPILEQEMTDRRWIVVPEEVRQIYAQWRPSPLCRALRLEQSLETPARIYYKYEGVSPAGSHKPNSAVPQAFYNRLAGTRRLTTETGAGQWGSSIAYACSKGALNTLTISLARVLAPEVRVNAVLPGFIETRWLKNGLGAERYAKYESTWNAQAALGVTLQPEDVAQSILYLLDSEKTTGQLLTLDAGKALGRL